MCAIHAYKQNFSNIQNIPVVDTLIYVWRGVRESHRFLLLMAVIYSQYFSYITSMDHNDVSAFHVNNDNTCVSTPHGCILAFVHVSTFHVTVEHYQCFVITYSC